MMNTTQSPAGPITDRDRQRACRMAHAFGAAITGGLALLLTAVTQFRTQPVPLPALITIGSVAAAAGGLLADLIARPPRVVFGDGWLAVSGPGSRGRVQTDRLVGLSANPRAAGTVVLVDEDGNRAEIEVRCLARNPLIWQRIHRDVARSRRRGSLALAGPDASFWEGVGREVAEADRRALAILDFEPIR